MTGVGRRLRGAWTLAEVLLDVLRSTRRVPRVRPAAGCPRGRLRQRARAVFLLLRIAAALRVPWSCRRMAFTVYRALTRGGVPARLCFGIRRAHGGSYCGHVWVSREFPWSAESAPSGFPVTIRLSAAEENAGWRRG